MISGSELHHIYIKFSMPFLTKQVSFSTKMSMVGQVSLKTKWYCVLYFGNPCPFQARIKNMLLVAIGHVNTALSLHSIQCSDFLNPIQTGLF